MKAITYINTATTLTNWATPLHIEQPRGYAYELDSHFVHFYGINSGLYVISPGLTVIEKKEGLLNDWAEKTFGAIDIKPMTSEVGEIVEGVWRPALYFGRDVINTLNEVQSETEVRLAEQALRLLIERLDELFLYIEPDLGGLNTYSHKTRELLILSCTEVENFWKYYMDKSESHPINGRSFTTKDYVKLADKLFLREYEFKLMAYTSIPRINPFLNWEASNSTASINWYDSYNKTKHDRGTHFSDATLLRCIEAVVANLVMYSVRFSPFLLFNQNNAFSSLVNQHFEVRLANASPESFYLHKIELPVGTRDDLICFNSVKLGHAKAFTANPLVL